MNLYLVGYRGSGKSTVAPLVAKLLDRNSVDTDQSIEGQTGQTVCQIFALRGESEFRQLESKTIHEFPATASLVISLGGGVLIANSNRQWIKKTGKTVWLTADPEILWKRICNDATSAARRPNLTDQGGLAEVQQVLAERNPVYRDCADYTIDVSRLSPEQVAEEIACWWKSVDKI